MIEVPWLDPEVIEKEAEIVLSDYSEKIKLITDPPVPVENIIEGLFGLQLVVEDVRGKGLGRDALGCIYIEEKIVVIDSTLENMEGRYHFTGGHEVGHWVLHKDLFLQEKNQMNLFPKKKEPSIICRESERKKKREWQADRFAAALLMPKKLLYAVLEDRNRELSPNFTDDTLRYWEISKEEYCRKVASQYNKIFGVSVQAMQIRLEELELLKQEVNRILL